MTENQLVVSKYRADELSVQQVVEQRLKIQELMAQCLKEGEHFGKVFAGQPKPSLFKAGAEYIGLTFKLVPQYDIMSAEDLPKGHIKYVIRCRLVHAPTGIEYGQGVGSCTSMESKYRFRNKKELTNREVPKEIWSFKSDRERQKSILQGAMGKDGDFWYGKGEDGKWYITENAVVENENPQDQDNTILKMAKKRAYVDAIITSTSASDFFTQDLEDIKANQDYLERKAKEADITEAEVIETKQSQGSTDDLNQAKEHPAWWYAYLGEAKNLKEQIIKAYGDDTEYYKTLGRFNMKKANDVDWKVAAEKDIHERCTNVFNELKLTLKRAADIPDQFKKKVGKEVKKMDKEVKKDLFNEQEK